MTAAYWEYRGSPILRHGAAVLLTVAIALLGAIMMTLTSSPLVKGAAFLWLPAALQLVAGVWLGPLRGGLAAGIGAQVAGILAYGGWAPADFIMNLIAGGLANAALPALLFQLFRLSPDLDAKAPKSAWVALAALLALAVIVVAVAIAQLYLFRSMSFVPSPAQGAAGTQPLVSIVGYAAPIVLLLLAPLLLRNVHLEYGQFLTGILIAIFSCFVSAAIGVMGAMVGGQTFEGAIVGTGIGWFFGDTASCILGLYALTQFGCVARARGLAPLWPLSTRGEAADGRDIGAVPQ